MKQVCVFIENKSGTLNDMAEVLANNNINMKAMSLSEADGFGIVRLITDDVYNATTVLKDAGFVTNLVPVVCAKIPDEPGGLLKVLNILKDKAINIEYMYAFSGGDGDADFVFKVADDKMAASELTSNGIEVLK